MFDKIVKLFSGEINSNERQQLDCWLEDENNNKSFHRIKKLWNLMDDYKSDYQPDYDKGLEEFQNRIKLEKANQQKGKTINMRRFTYWAAASVAAIVSGFLLWNVATTDNMQTYYTQTGESKTFYLPDSSYIVMNENTEVSFLADFKVRNVNIKGEAFFDVYRDTLKPFTVGGLNSRIEVLGTSFNVRSYGSKENDKVDVFSGKVAFSDKDNSNERVVLKKGDVAVLEGHKIRSDKIRDYNFMFYKTRELSFSNASLQDVAKELEKYYHQKIIITNDELKSEKLTTLFKAMSIDEIMRELEIVLDIRVERNQDTWQLKSKE